MTIATITVVEAGTCTRCRRVPPARHPQSLAEYNSDRALRILAVGYCMCPDPQRQEVLPAVQGSPGGLASMSTDTQEIYRELIELSLNPPPVDTAHLDEVFGPLEDDLILGPLDDAERAAAARTDQVLIPEPVAVQEAPVEPDTLDGIPVQGPPTVVDMPVVVIRETLAVIDGGSFQLPTDTSPNIPVVPPELVPIAPPQMTVVGQAKVVRHQRTVPKKRHRKTARR
jgi:hypothetical protein